MRERAGPPLGTETEPRGESTEAPMRRKRLQSALHDAGARRVAGRARRAGGRPTTLR